MVKFQIIFHDAVREETASVSVPGTGMVPSTDRPTKSPTAHEWWMYHTGLDFFMKAGWRNMEKNQKNLFFLRNSDPFVSRITIHPNFGAVFGLKKRSCASRQICHLYSGNCSTLKYAKIVNAWKINEKQFPSKISQTKI